jgi:xanthosine utilization system XapX-like protein
MFFSEKIETVGGIKDFLKVSPSKKKLAGALTGLTVGAIATALQAPPQAVPAMAMPMPILGLSVSEKIIHAFDPIVSLLQGMSYPVCFIMLSAGFLVIMTGNRSKGLNMIKWAAIGFIGMQFAPAIMAILVEVGKAIGK